MAFKKPQITTVKTDIQSLKIYLRAVKKFGKTTLFRDVVLEKFGDPSKGMLVGVGNEVGYKILDNLNATQAETWQDLEEIKKWLITEKGKEHDIEIVAFDTVDELMPLAEDEVIRLSKKETGKPCKTFNSAFGGFGEPRKQLVKLVKEYFGDLDKAGIAPFAIGHTKVKNIKEKGDDGEGYQTLSANLSNDYESVFSDIFDCVLTGYIDKDIQNGKLAGSSRKLYLRGDGFIDAGCRFASGSVPEYISFDSSNNAAQFIKTLEDGLKNSRTIKVTDKEFKKMQEEEVKERQQVSEEFKKQYVEIDVDKNQELIEKIKTNISNLDVAKMQSIMKEYDFENFSEPSAIRTEALEKIVELIK